MFTVFLLCPALIAPPPAPIAMVLEVSGEVSFQRDKIEPRPVHAMRMLFSGDRLKSAKNGAVLVVFRDADRRERLGANVEATIDAAGFHPAGTVEKLPEEQRAAIGNGLKTLALGERGAVKLFRTGPEGEPPAVTPIFESRELSDRPGVSWPEAAHAKGYRVQMSIAGSGAPLWNEKSPTASLKYPEMKAALRRGRSHEWSVYAEIGDDPPRLVAKSVFAVASEDELDELKPLRTLIDAKGPRSGELLMAALGYHAVGVYGEALVLFERLCELNPDNGEFHAARAEYYERAGRTKEAKSAWKRAQELGYAVPKEKRQ